MSRRDVLVAEVLAVLHEYQEALEYGTREDLQKHVHLPVVYVTEDNVQLRDRYPFDPQKLRVAMDFHHSNAEYAVMHIDETKAHIAITATRMREDDSPIENVEAFYILQNRDDQWKIAAFSGIRTAA